MQTNWLQVQDLCFRYEDSPEWVLRNISFQLAHSESLGIIGPNGGGKTTLLNLLLGLLRASSGHIHKGPLSEDFESFFGYVPQFTFLNPHFPMQVYDLILTGPDLKKSTRRKQRAEKLLKRIHLYEQRDQLVSSLSGGQRQKLLLARALMGRPAVLVLDEPTTGLDSLGCDQLLNLLQEEKRARGTGVLMVDHNINQILSHCDKILCLNKTHHWHDKKELFNHNILESIYHCEFEHKRIHEEKGLTHQHELCEHPDPKKHGH